MKSLCSRFFFATLQTMEISVRFELTKNEVAARPLRPLGHDIICRKERRRVFIPNKRSTLRTLKSSCACYPTAGRRICA